jgi:hypothetical protein
VKARWLILLAIVAVVGTSMSGVLVARTPGKDRPSKTPAASPVAPDPSPTASVGPVGDDTGLPAPSAEPGPWADWVPPTWDDPVSVVGPVVAASSPPPDPGAASVTAATADAFVESPVYGLVPANQIALVLEAGPDRAAAESIAAQLGGRIIGEVELVGAYLVETAGTTVADLEAGLAAARAIDGVAYATTNQGTATFSETGEIWGVRMSPLEDPAYAGERGDGYELIGVQAAWDYIRASGIEVQPARIGIVDDGLYAGTGEFDGGTTIETTEPDASLATPKPITASDGNTYADPTGSHGTGVATIACGDADDGGAAGVASVLGAKLTCSHTNLWSPTYGGKVTPTAADPKDPTIQDYGQYGPSQFGDMVAIMAQVKAAKDTVPPYSTVINLSWGAKDPKTTDPEVVKAYRAFFTKLSEKYPNVTFVAAAGNEGQAVDGAQYYPAGFNLPNIITVGNVRNDASVDATSNRPGKDFEVSIFAPGTQSVQGYDRENQRPLTTVGGTSQAAPQVTATVALLKSLNPDLTGAQIKRIIDVTARQKGGIRILAVDEAVRFVIDLNRKLAGLPPLSPEELRNRGVVDAVARPLKDAPGEYLVRGIVQAVDEKAGTDLTISVDGGKVIEGRTPRFLAKPGQLGWIIRLNETKGTVIVRRTDTEAGSRILIEPIDINGTWKGTFTFTRVDIDPELLKLAEEEGCTIDSLDSLKGKALPLTMVIRVDKKGRGEVVMTIDMSSIKDKKGVPLESEPQTLQFTYSGNVLTFKAEAGSGVKGSMTGFAKKTGDIVTISGTMSQKGKGISIRAVWSVSG